MKATKFLSALLALVMVLGLAACGGEASVAESAPAETASSAPAEEAPAVEEPATEEAPAVEEEASAPAEEVVEEPVADPMAIMAEEHITYPLEGDNTISMWYYQPGYVEFVDSNYNFNALDTAEAATGVKLEFVEVPESTAFEQFNLMIAGGDMCDLIPAASYYTGGISKAYEEDIVLDITEYMEECMPNFYGVWNTLDANTQKEATSDGMLLAFPTIADGSFNGNGLVTRKDWMDEQGIEFSGNTIGLEEFTDLMRTLYNAYNCKTTYYMFDGQMAVEAAFDTEIPALVADGFMTQVTISMFRYGDEVVSAWTTDGYRAYIEWVLSLMDEGIIYKDWMSLDGDMMVRNAACGDGSTAVWQANADKIEEIPQQFNPDMTVCPVPNVVKDTTAPYVWLQQNSLVTSGFSMSNDCVDPELVCQWMNYFWTTEGYYLANYGEEGESYHFEGDTAVFDWDQPVTVTGRTAGNAEMAQQLFTMMRFTSFYSDHDRLFSTFADSAMSAIELWNCDGTDERFYPTTLEAGFTAEENEAIAEYEADLLTYAAEECLKFMTGALELNDANWDNYVSTCEEMGLSEIVAVYQNAYDQYLAGER